MTQRLRRTIAPFLILNLRIFTFMTRRPRARVLVFNEIGDVLLVKPVVSRGHWTLPGGGLNRKESAVDAAQRELYEETGIRADKSRLVHIATLKQPDHDIPFTAPLFRIHIQRAMLPDVPFNKHEIEDIRWFDQDNLPENVSRTVLTALVINRESSTDIAAGGDTAVQ